MHIDQRRKTMLRRRDMFRSFTTIGRNAAVFLALFLALGGSAVAAGKLLTGADIEDNSLTGADIVESSLAQVPNAANADQLGGTAPGSFLKKGTVAGGALEGTYPDPDIATDAVTANQIKDQSVGAADLGFGAAAANIWGKDRWALYTATQRGYSFVDRTHSPVAGDLTSFESVSYPVPLAPGESVSVHAIGLGEDLPDGCDGHFYVPEAKPGHLCVYYAYDALINDDPAAVLAVDAPSDRFGFRLWVKYDANPCSCHAAINVTWAMTPALPR
jgi:hypothetical protein